MSKTSINFKATDDFKNALDQYCKDRDISVSSFIKSLVAEVLIKNKYLEENK